VAGWPFEFLPAVERGGKTLLLIANNLKHW